MPKNLPEFVSVQHKDSIFYEVFTTISWRNFMCLRCVRGPRCGMTVLSPSALDLLIDLNVQGGVCAMFYKRDWWTRRMRHYHHRNTWSELYWYATGIRRKMRSRVMLATNKPMFDHLTQKGGGK